MVSMIRVTKLEVNSAIAADRQTIHTFAEKPREGMSDNPDLTDYRDRDRIDVHQDHELRYWSKEVGVAAEILKDTVQDAGVMVADVRRELRKGAKRLMCR